METGVRYGVTKKKINNRIKKDKEHREQIARPLEIIVQTIKDFNDWSQLSYAKMKEIAPIQKTNNREPLLFFLQENKNIITKIPEHIELIDGKIPHTVTVEYLYVDEQEKIDLGFDAVVYRNVTEKALKQIKEVFCDFDELKRLNISVNAILAFIDYLLKEKCDLGYREINIVNCSRLTGIPIVLIMKMIELFEEKRVMIFAPPRYFTLTCDDEVYKERLAEKESGEIEEIDRKKQTRQSAMMQKVTAVLMNKSEDEINIINSLDSNIFLNNDEGISDIEELPKALSDIKKLFNYTINKYSKNVEQLIINANNSNQESIEIAKKLNQENIELNNRLKTKDAKIASLEHEVRLLKDYNLRFQQFIQGEAMVFSGTILSSTNEDFDAMLQSKDITYRAKMKQKIMGIIAKETTRFVETLNSYKDETQNMPENLKA